MRSVNASHQTNTEKSRHFLARRHAEMHVLIRSLTVHSLTAHKVAPNNLIGRSLQVAPGFWNYRTDFFVVKLFNIKTHMSVARLKSGK